MKSKETTGSGSEKHIKSGKSEEFVRESSFNDGSVSSIDNSLTSSGKE